MSGNSNIAIFASGSGSNAQKIIEYFQDSGVNIVKIFSNKSDAFVLERAKGFNIPTLVFNKSEFNSPEFLKELEGIDFIVLAGFLLLVPSYLIQAYPNKIVNIHPALLPKYGGAGMHGIHVHKAVVDNKETETGITIHFVNEKYDEGEIIYQAKCSVNSSDTPESVARKVLELEWIYYPQIIEMLTNSIGPVSL